MATSPEPGPGLGVFCVINGDESRCRPEAVRKFFCDEVGNCRIVTSSRSYDNEKTFVTMEFSSVQNANYALTRKGCKVNGCRISASPFRSRRLGNLIGQGPGNNRFGNQGHRPFNTYNNRGGWFPGNQRGGFQPHFKKGRSWGEQESEKVKGMSPKTAARYIEQRIRDKEERTNKRAGKRSSYSPSQSRSRSRSASSHSQSRSPSYRKRYSSASSDNAHSRSRSRSPRRRKKSRRSKSVSGSSPSPYRSRHRQSRSKSESQSGEERRSKDHRRRRKKRRHRRHSTSSESEQSHDIRADLVGEMEDWATRSVETAEPLEVTEVLAEEVVPPEVASFNSVDVIEEVAGNNGTGRPVLPPLPSTELNLNIPSSLSLSVQQQALERRHSMQQEFEADVSTITSVTEMLERHDQSIALPLRRALLSVVAEVTSKYTVEFQDHLKGMLSSKPS